MQIDGKVQTSSSGFVCSAVINTETNFFGVMCGGSALRASACAARHTRETAQRVFRFFLLGFLLRGQITRSALASALPAAFGRP